jgi:hypothetical protein
MIGALAVGYALAIPFVTGVLQTPITITSFANITAFAILFTVIVTIWLDRPLELELIKWPEKKPKPEPPPVAAEAVEVEPQQITGAQIPKIALGDLFPHEPPTEHWNVDFGDSKQVYEGADLPVWLLAGWAAFIIWAVVYLISGLPTAF